MKLKKGVVLGNVDGNDFAITTGKLTKKFNGIINNNKTAAYIFRLLEKEQSEDSLVKAMCAKYEVSEAEARADVREIIEQIKALGILE
jgi:ubiquitin-protein ligase